MTDQRREGQVAGYLLELPLPPIQALSVPATPLNCDLSDNSEAELGGNDFYIEDSEPADLEGLMVAGFSSSFQSKPSFSQFCILSGQPS